MSKNCIDIHTPHLKSKFNKLIKSGVKEKDAELEIALEEAKRIFNSLNNLKTKLGLKLSEEDKITNAIVTTKAEDFQDLSETFDLEGELKTKIAALEKIIKDAESEDAPATVKQKLIEKGNAKLAEMKAELATIQHSKNETSSTDDKKADIERRRQLTINSITVVTDPNDPFEEIGTNEAYYQEGENAGKSVDKNLVAPTREQVIDKINAKYDAELASLKTPKEKLQENINDLNIVQDISLKAQEIKNKAQSKLDELNKTEENKQETPIEKLRRLAKEKIEESKLQSTSEFNYRGGTYTIDYNRNLLSPIPKTATAQKNLIDSMDKQKIGDKKVYDISIKKINDKDVYLVYHNILDKFVILDKNLNSIPLDESVLKSDVYKNAFNKCK